jgi:hypothetical protein
MSRTTRKPSHRIKKYRGLKKVRDGSITRSRHSCTNHGGCPHCEGNRLYNYRKQPLLKDFLEDL